MYKLNDIPLRSIGAIPCLKKERIALEGFFSFPKRKGTTEYNWGTSIEPFVEAHEMVFEGRTLTLNAWLRGDTPEQYARVLRDFRTACIGCRKLSTGYADFDVLLKEEVKITEYIGHNRAVATASFWQETVAFPALIAPSGGDGYLLNGYNLYNDFGIRVSERKDNQSIGKRIEVNTTEPYTKTEYRDPQAITLKCYLRGDGFAGMYTKMTRFHALCASPGLQVLCFPDGSERTGYVKDGFIAKVIHSTRVDFTLKLRVI